MSVPIVRVRRATLHAIAPDAASAFAVLRTGEAVFHSALEAAARSLGDEVLVLRRLDHGLVVRLDGRSPLPEARLAHALRRALARTLLSLRPASNEPVITPQVAWFPSEASAIGEIIAAHAEGRASAWPYSTLGLWGSTPSEVLGTCLARGRLFLGDALAHIIRRLDASRLPAVVPEVLAAPIVEAWTGGGGRAIATSALPAAVRAAIGADVAGVVGASLAQRDLVALVRLLDLWPPARDARVPLEVLRALGSSEEPSDTPRHVSGEESLRSVLAGLLETPDVRGYIGGLPRKVRAAMADALARQADRPLAVVDAIARLNTLGVTEDELRRLVASERAPARRLVSTAGGLLAWARLFDGEGLFASIAAAYPEPRAERAVRWAIGRALEDPRVGGADPILLLWAGEDPTGLADPVRGLAAADPEPLHRVALATAGRSGLFATPLEAAPFGDWVVATSESGFCVDAILTDPGTPSGTSDTVLAPTPHDAIPEIVRRFNRRAGAPPPGIRVAERMRDDHVEAWVEVDVPALPEPWRAAVRAFASLARELLRRRMRTAMKDLQRWPAIVEMGPNIAVELGRSLLSRIGAGDDRAMEVGLFGIAVDVRIT
jgi:hypothetical protein